MKFCLSVLDETSHVGYMWCCEMMSARLIYSHATAAAAAVAMATTDNMTSSHLMLMTLN